MRLLVLEKIRLAKLAQKIALMIQKSQTFALAIKSHQQNIHRIALAKYIWKFLKNHSNEIRSNEIRISLYCTRKMSSSCKAE